MDEKTDTLAQRLKLARAQRGLTQVQLADKAGVKQSDVSKLERGKALSTASIARLARALRVSPGWLEENEGGLPDWNAADVRSAVVPVSLTEAEIVAQLRPEWRALILAYEELLPEDRETMTQPILKKANEMRRHFQLGLAKLGIQHNPLASTGNDLPAAPPYLGQERRRRTELHAPDRRHSQPIGDGLSPGMPMKAKRGQA